MANRCAGDSKTSPFRVRPTYKSILSRSGGSMSEQTRSTTNGSGAAGPREVLVYGDAKGCGWKRRRTYALRLTARSPGLVHLNNRHDVCSAQRLAAARCPYLASTFEDPRTGLRRVRNQGRQTRPHRARDQVGGAAAERGATDEAS